MKQMILMLPLLAACQAAPTGATPPTATPPAAGGDSCGAAQYADLVGRSYGAVTLPADLNLRLINPGEMVTMDYAPDRLNIELDAGGQITEVRCG